VDQAVTTRIDHLLRTDPRLAAAAPLIGRIPAIITEPKPPRARRKRGGKKLPPPRPGEIEPLRDALGLGRDGRDDEDEEQAQGPASPWLKVVKVKKVPPHLKEALGADALAIAVVDGWLWGQLNSAIKDAALIVALRSLVWEEKDDGSDLVRREPPPIQTWPDCIAETSNLVAALTEHPGEAAAMSSAVDSLVMSKGEDFAGRFIHDEGPDPQDGEEGDE